MRQAFTDTVKSQREMQLENYKKKMAIKHKHRELTVQTLNLDTNRQNKEETTETQQAYCTRDMKGTVITGLVLSLINLQHFRERARDEKQRKASAHAKQTHTRRRNQGRLIG